MVLEQFSKSTGNVKLNHYLILYTDDSNLNVKKKLNHKQSEEDLSQAEAKTQTL